MGTVLVKEVVRRISFYLDDLAPQFFHIPEYDIVTALNEGQIAVGKFMPWALARTDVVKLATGARQHIGSVLAANIKPGDGSTAADTHGIRLLDVIRNMGTDGLTPGNQIANMQREKLDALDPAWTSRTDTKAAYYAFDPRTPLVFYIYPGLSAAAWVEISWQTTPGRIPNTGTAGSELYAYTGSSTATLSVGDEFVDDVVMYALALLSIRFPVSAAHVSWAQNQFIQSVNAQVTAMTGTNPNLKYLPMVPAIPATAQ